MNNKKVFLSFRDFFQNKELNKESLNFLFFESGLSRKIHNCIKISRWLEDGKILYFHKLELF